MRPRNPMIGDVAVLVGCIVCVATVILIDLFQSGTLDALIPAIASIQH